ncbi:MAG: hypothetical protein RLZZ196_71 [Bacteroidota bacterium]|jgi:hypothetical protein
MQIDAGVSISLDQSTWYKLTDHNRQPISYTPQRIEQSQRMANGTMRKMVIANKAVYDISWQDVPSATQSISTQSGISVSQFSPTVDGNYGAGFLKAFYDQYVFQPIWVKLTYAKDSYSGNSHNSSKIVVPSTSNHLIIKAFITDFKYTVKKRLTLSDYVDMSIQFTEV